jgi:hypothetical protein
VLLVMLSGKFFRQVTIIIILPTITTILHPITIVPILLQAVAVLPLPEAVLRDQVVEFQGLQEIN